MVILCISILKSAFETLIWKEFKSNSLKCKVVSAEPINSRLDIFLQRVLSCQKWTYIYVSQSVCLYHDLFPTFKDQKRTQKL